MKAVNLKLINNRKGNGNAVKPSAIELRMTFSRKVKYISSGIKVCTTEWNDGEVVNRDDADELNLQLSQLLMRVRKIISEMKEQGFVDLDAVPGILDVKVVDMSFWGYIEKRGMERNVSGATHTRYETFLSMLQKFGFFQTFQEVTPSNIRKFDEFLHKQGYKQSTIHGYHKQMKVFINDAMVDEMLKTNPYTTSRIKIDRGNNSLDKYLSEEELSALRNCKLFEPSYVRVRDIFLFACYTGLAFSDLMSYDYRKATTEYGYKVITGQRTKSGKEYIIVLLKEALDILKKYNYQLPVISNQKYNAYLRSICVRAGIDKPVTSHWARHTAAMVMLNKGVPIEVVAKVLGHANINTTQSVYAKVLKKTVVESFVKHMA